MSAGPRAGAGARWRLWSRVPCEIEILSVTASASRSSAAWSRSPSAGSLRAASGNNRCSHRGGWPARSARPNCASTASASCSVHGPGQSASATAVSWLGPCSVSMARARAIRAAVGSATASSAGVGHAAGGRAEASCSPAARSAAAQDPGRPTAAPRCQRRGWAPAVVLAAAGAQPRRPAGGRAERGQDFGAELKRIRTGMVAAVAGSPTRTWACTWRTVAPVYPQSPLRMPSP